MPLRNTRYQCAIFLKQVLSMVAILTLFNMFFFYDKIAQLMETAADDSPDENDIEAKAQSSEVQSYQSITDEGGLSFRGFPKQETPQVRANHPFERQFFG